MLAIVLQPPCVKVKQFGQLDTSTLHDIGNAFFIIGQFYDAVCLNLVHGTAGRIKLRDKIEFQELIRPLPVTVNIKID